MAKLPEYAEYKAPWEKEGRELDPELAKKFAYSLLQQNQTLNEKVAAVTGERDGFKAKVDEAARQGESETEALKREKKELEDKLASVPDTSAEVLKLTVALEQGLTPHQAKRLVGTTKDELEADAKELVESFGGSGKGEDNGDKPPSRTPRRLNNAGDPDPDGDEDIDVGKALESIPRL